MRRVVFVIKHHYSNAVKTAYLGHLTIPEFFLILSYEVKRASKKYQLKKPKNYVGYGVDNGSGSENMHLFYIGIYDLPPGCHAWKKEIFWFDEIYKI